MQLDDAAKIVNIPKKTLDGYYRDLTKAYITGFNYTNAETIDIR
jgi:hypothetical protein